MDKTESVFGIINFSLILWAKVKKAIAYLFLVFLLFNFSSAILVLKLMQLDAKYEMARMIMKSQKTEKLAFHKNTFKEHLEQGSEIDWQNKRYDIVSAVYECDSVFIEAIHDSREQGIVHLIGKLVSKQSEKGRDASRFSSISLIIFQAPLPNHIDFSAAIIVISSNYFTKKYPIICAYKKVASPPPKAIFV